MPRIVVEDVQAWVESSKLNPQALDLNYLDQLETEVLSRLAAIYDTSSWTDNTNTPRLVQVIIAKTYAGWLYDKFYSENQSDPSQYAMMVKENASTLLMGLLDGTIEIQGVNPTNPAIAAFYPNDASSAQIPTTIDPSLGPAKFSLGKSF